MKVRFFRKIVRVPPLGSYILDNLMYSLSLRDKGVTIGVGIKLHHTLEIFLITVFLTIASTIAAFMPIWGNLLLTILFPLLVIYKANMVPFERLKISTLLIGRVLTLLTALTVLPGDWFIVLIVGLLYINILEAVLTDLKRKSYFNVISGAALLATAYPFFDATWKTVMPGDGEGLVHIGFYVTNRPCLVFWIIAYTIWNWGFVVHEFSHNIARYHIAVLGVPLLFCLITLNPGYWLLMRGVSLTFAGAIQIAFKDCIEMRMEHATYKRLVSKVKTKKAYMAATTAILILCFMHIFQHYEFGVYRV